MINSNNKFQIGHIIRYENSVGYLKLSIIGKVNGKLFTVYKIKVIETNVPSWKKTEYFPEKSDLYNKAKIVGRIGPLCELLYDCKL
jgi:hypothetical protein